MTDEIRARHDWLKTWWGFVIVIGVAIGPMTAVVLLGLGPLLTWIVAGFVLLILIAVSAAKGKALQERVSLLLSLLAVAGVVTVLANLQKEAEERTVGSQVEAALDDLMGTNVSQVRQAKEKLVKNRAHAVLPLVDLADDCRFSLEMRERVCDVLLRIWQAKGTDPKDKQDAANGLAYIGGEKAENALKRAAEGDAMPQRIEAIQALRYCSNPDLVKFLLSIAATTTIEPDSALETLMADTAAHEALLRIRQDQGQIPFDDLPEETQAKIEKLLDWPGSTIDQDRPEAQSGQPAAPEGAE